MERFLLAVALAVVALGVAWVLGRRTRRVDEARPAYAAPTQLDRRDFSRPDAPWLVAVFTSATCSTCAAVWEKAQALESPAVAVEELEASARPDVHRRYRIEAVPITVVADASGAVRASFMGPVPAADLWAAVAGVRDQEPGGPG